MNNQEYENLHLISEKWRDRLEVGVTGDPPSENPRKSKVFDKQQPPRRQPFPVGPAEQVVCLFFVALATEC